MSDSFYDIISILINRLDDSELSTSSVIQWGAPVPSFGDSSVSTIATLGLNPSNREFVDERGNELEGPSRRFHTLRSLELGRWRDTANRHLVQIGDTCREYFYRNPYDNWFRRLDYLLSGVNASYYSDSLIHNPPIRACHLDLIPYATSCKWTALTLEQRSSLLAATRDTLGLILRDSSIRLLILNGSGVVERFQSISGARFEKQMMWEWSLPRASQRGVAGVAYEGLVTHVSDIDLEREILVLGFNHNIQSSFGVTTQVRDAIKSWISSAAEEII